MTMTWTKDKPTRTGWYWYRGDHDAGGSPETPVIIRVEPDNEGTNEPPDPLVAWQPFMDYTDELDAFTGEWCGPIEPPA